MRWYPLEDWSRTPNTVVLSERKRGGERDREVWHSDTVKGTRQKKEKSSVAFDWLDTWTMEIWLDHIVIQED